MAVALTVRIPVRDQNGRVIDEKEVATYAGLLAKAHDEGLQRVTTTLVQAPSEANANTAIVHAEVVTKAGTFAGIGDANPSNVNRRVVPHVIRMAETRAKARALRDAVNIGVVSLEELGGDGDEVADAPKGNNVRQMRPRPHVGTAAGDAPPARTTAPADGERMTPAQRRLVFRLLSEQGYEGDAALKVLCELLKVRHIDDITKSQASTLIDRWKRQGLPHAS